MNYTSSTPTASPPVGDDTLSPPSALAASYERQSYAYEEGINAQYDINANAAARDGRRIPDNPRYRFSDDDTSGAMIRRNGFDRLRALVESGRAPFKYVYVKDTARLGRFDDPRYHFHLEVVFEQHGVKILYATDDDRSDYKDANPDQIFPHFFRKAFNAVAATNERHTTKRRTGSGVRRRVKRGFFPGSIAPYATRRWLVDLETRALREEVPQCGTIRATGAAYTLRWAEDHSVHIVREIFARILKGQSLRAIAVTLNKRGVPCPGAERGVRVKDPDTGLERAPTWGAGEIQKIARNPIYCGDLIWGRTRRRLNGEPLPVDQADIQNGREGLIVVDFIEKPIIRRVRWLAVQDILAGNRLTRDRRRASSPGYLLTGLVTCTSCGGSLHGHTNRYSGCRYYRHDSKPADRTARSCFATCVHRGRYIRADLLECPVLDLVRYVLTDGRLAELARAELTRLLDDNFAVGRADTAAKTLEHVGQLEVGIAKAARNAAMAQNETEEESYRNVAQTLSEEAQRLKASISEMDAEIARAKAVEARLATEAKVPTPLDAFEEEPAVVKKEVVASFVERVIVDCEAATAEVVVRAMAA